MNWQYDMYQRYHGRYPTRHNYVPGIKMFYWMGWRGYADDLYKHGWQFAQWEEQSPVRYGGVCHIATYHPQLQAEGRGHFSPEEFIHKSGDRQFRDQCEGRWGGPPHLPIEMQLAQRVMSDYPNPHTWRLANVMPDGAASRIRVPDPEWFYGIRDIPVFEYLKEPSKSGDNRILLEEATMSDVLKYALEKQRPIQEAIRQKRIKRSRLVTELHLAQAA